MGTVHNGSSSCGSLMATLMTLIKVTLTEEGMFSMSTFRTLESIRPSDIEKMRPAIFLRFKPIHKINKIHFFLLHASHLPFVLEAIIADLIHGGNSIVI